MKKTLFKNLLLISLLFFVAVPVVNAQILVEENYDNENSTNWNRSGANILVQAIEYTPGTTVSDIKYVSVEIQKNSTGTGTIGLVVTQDTGGTPSGATTVATSNNITIASEMNTLNCDFTDDSCWINFEFASTFSLTGSQTYYFVVEATVQDDPTLNSGTNGTDLEWQYVTGTGWVNPNSDENSFRLIGEAGLEYISFVTPTDSYNDVDFQKWILDFNVEEAGEYQVRVDYYQGVPNSSPVTFSDFVSFSGLAGERTNFELYKQRALYNIFSNADWNATAYLVDLANASGSVVVATSTEITFSITGSVPDTEYSTSSVGSEGLDTLFALDDCSAYEGGLFSSSTLQALGCVAVNSGKTLARFLLIPQDNVEEYFFTSVQNIQTVFPFSLILGSRNLIKSAINENNIDDNPGLTLNLEINGDTEQIVFLTEDTLDNTLFNNDADFKNTVFNWILMLFIVAFVWITSKLAIKIL